MNATQIATIIPCKKIDDTYKTYNQITILMGTNPEIKVVRG